MSCKNNEVMKYSSWERKDILFILKLNSKNF